MQLLLPLEEALKQVVSKKEINAKDGSVVVTYFMQNEKLPQTILRGQLAKNYVGFQLIERDLQQALRWARRAAQIVETQLVSPLNDSEEDENYYWEVQNGPVYEELQAFFVAALSFYGKAFTGADVRGTVVQHDWIDPAFVKMHRQFWDYRNNLAAHAGGKDFGSAHLVFVPTLEGVFPEIKVARMQHSHFVAANGGTFESLIEHVLSIVHQRAHDTMMRIYQELFEVMGHDAVLRKIDSGQPIDVQTKPSNRSKRKGK
ncbi:hypothetical protein [Herbaspirillum huttiense]|uniref:hypothetical protein n=1 Tax=Herbaspirillum huttiense TaxID=863372 RepID=UPI0031D14B16